MRRISKRRLRFALGGAYAAFAITVGMTRGWEALLPSLFPGAVTLLILWLFRAPPRPTQRFVHVDAQGRTTTRAPVVDPPLKE